MYPNVTFSNLWTINDDNEIQDSKEVNNRSVAYVNLVIMEDLKVPPKAEQKAYPAAAPQQENNDDACIIGIETIAPIIARFLSSFCYGLSTF